MNTLKQNYGLDVGSLLLFLRNNNKVQSMVRCGTVNIKIQNVETILSRKLLTMSEYKRATIANGEHICSMNYSRLKKRCGYQVAFKAGDKTLYGEIRHMFTMTPSTGSSVSNFDIVQLVTYDPDVSASENMGAEILDIRPHARFCLLEHVLHKVKMSPLIALNLATVDKLLVTTSFHSVRAKYAKNDDDN